MTALDYSNAEGNPGQPSDSIEILPVVVLSKNFPARPSAIPEIRDFVQRSLADSPLTAAGNLQVSQTLFRALLDAAGPTGTIQISFRIFPEHVEVDVLHSERLPGETILPPPVPPAQARQPPAAPTRTVPPAPPGPLPVSGSASFAEWMSEVLRREGLTHEAAARQLGVSVRTVSRWVGGETEPRLRDLRRIQERFGGSAAP